MLPDGSTFSHLIVGLCNPGTSGNGCGLGDRCPTGGHGQGRVDLGSVDVSAAVSADSVEEPAVEQKLQPVPEKWLGSGSKQSVRPSDVVPQVPEPKRSWLRRGKGSDVKPDVPSVPPTVQDSAVVVDLVEEAARDLAAMVWNSPVLLPRTRFTPADDQALIGAVAQGWLEQRGELVVKGRDDPRPPEAPVSAAEQRMRWGPGW